MNNSSQNTKNGKPLMASHRQSELNMLLSKKVQRVLRRNVKLITYNDFKKADKVIESH